MTDQPPRRFYVVHDERGRILGLAPVREEQVNERIRLGYRPIPGPGQKVIEVDLTEEHASLLPHELLDFEVAMDPRTGSPRLRRRR
jgi:hypothetical protein